MADTTYIKQVIEPFVRQWLTLSYPGHAFKERSVALPDGEFNCDAVSADGSIIASIMSNRPRTVSGNENSAAVKKAMTEIHGLKSMNASRRILICTDEMFRQLAMKRTKRYGTDGILFLFCRLPDDLQRQLNQNLDASSREQRNRND